MANIANFEPFNSIVDDLFKGFFVRPLAYEGREGAVRMKLDVTENNGGYVVTAELPGVRNTCATSSSTSLDPLPSTIWLCSTA